MKPYNVPNSKLCTCEKKESNGIVFKVLLMKYQFIHSKLKTLKERLLFDSDSLEGF